MPTEMTPKATQDINQELLTFINESPTAYHAIASVKKMLSGYTQLHEEEDWNLQPGGSYYVTRNDSSLIAFCLPIEGYRGVLMAAAHCDSPLFKLKPHYELLSNSAYLRLNTEKYGGMLLAPWFDRPLSIAGRVIVKRDGAPSFESRLVDLKAPVAVIPNLAIHLNRKANDGMTYDPQVDLLPLIGGASCEGHLSAAIASAAGVSENSIYGSDLYLYNAMEGQITGIDGELILSRSLDDLQCVWGLVYGLTHSTAHPTHMSMCCVLDNEEVGSSTRQGADSTFLSDTLERIASALGVSDHKQKQLLANSFLISADNAHALHPAHAEKADPTNRVYLNRGIVLKFNANQKYTTDGMSEAIIRSLCEGAGVPLQEYTNPSNLPGGSTLGNISAGHVSVRSADIGLPMLAMHSPYETAGTSDTESLVKMMTTYYSCGVVR